MLNGFHEVKEAPSSALGTHNDDIFGVELVKPIKIYHPLLSLTQKISVHTNIAQPFIWSS